jgi:hypothetical protein
VSINSRDQYRETRPKGKQSKLRWVGQFMVLVSPDDADRFLAGTWWDEEAAANWALALMAERRGWVAIPFELQFKDYWLPFRRSGLAAAGVVDVPTGGLL